MHAPCRRFLTRLRVLACLYSRFFAVTEPPRIVIYGLETESRPSSPCIELSCIVGPMHRLRRSRKTVLLSPARRNRFPRNWKASRVFGSEKGRRSKKTPARVNNTQGGERGSGIASDSPQERLVGRRGLSQVKLAAVQCETPIRSAIPHHVRTLPTFAERGKGHKDCERDTISEPEGTMMGDN